MTRSRWPTSHSLSHSLSHSHSHTHTHTHTLSLSLTRSCQPSRALQGLSSTPLVGAAYGSRLGARSDAIPSIAAFWSADCVSLMPRNVSRVDSCLGVGARHYPRSGATQRPTAGVTIVGNCSRLVRCAISRRASIARDSAALFVPSLSLCARCQQSPTCSVHRNRSRAISDRLAWLPVLLVAQGRR
jgi:hypothetical protein